MRVVRSFCRCAVKRPEEVGLAHRREDAPARPDAGAAAWRRDCRGAPRARSAARALRTWVSQGRPRPLWRSVARTPSEEQTRTSMTHDRERYCDGERRILRMLLLKRHTSASRVLACQRTRSTYIGAAPTECQVFTLPLTAGDVYDRTVNIARVVRARKTKAEPVQRADRAPIGDCAPN